MTRRRVIPLFSGATLLALTILFSTGIPSRAASPRRAAPSQRDIAGPVDFTNWQEGWGEVFDTTKHVARIYRTDNGGGQWSLKLTVKKPGLVGSGGLLSTYVHFVSGSTGFVAATGHDPRIFRTVSRGKSWHVFPLPKNRALAQDLDFINAGDGWDLLADEVGTGHETVNLYRTTNGGRKWTRVAWVTGAAPHSGLQLAGYKTGISFRNANQGWIAGFDFSGKAYAYLSSNGGRSWKRKVLVRPVFHYPAGTSESSALSPQAPVFFSKGGGLLVVPYELTGNKACLVERFVYRYKASHSSWTSPTALPGLVNCKSSTPYASQFASPSSWSVGAGTTLWRTFNAGNTWTALHPTAPKGVQIAQIDFPPGLSGWDPGWTVFTGRYRPNGDAGSGRILYSTDGGYTWVQTSGLKVPGPTCPPYTC